MATSIKVIQEVECPFCRTINDITEDDRVKGNTYAVTCECDGEVVWTDEGDG